MNISMDGKGLYGGNILVGGVAHREVRRCVSESLRQRHEGPHGTGRLLPVRHNQRPHQALGFRTPAEVVHEAKNARGIKGDGRSTGTGVGSTGMCNGTLA